MRFTPDFIEQVRDANNLAEIVGQYTELKGNGHRLAGRCPFPDHLDKSPSFSVSVDRQLYICYGCKKGGNVYTFLETFNGMSFPEAVEFLARRAGIALPEKEMNARKGGATHDQRDALLKINKTAAVYYHQQLKQLTADHSARAYMQKRGLTAEVIEKFRLGCASDEWQGLTRYLSERQIPVGQVESLGLIKPKKVPKAGDSHFDLFRERLMFPIFSSTNDVIGFGGRAFGDALPKYLNSHDSPVFNKSRVLYGIHETGKHIRAQDHALVVEGYMDAIALYTAGIKNVVAILGTAFTPDHAKILKRYTHNVTMLLDGDDAGISGAERSLPILLEAGIMPKGFALPEKTDPDEFVKAHGPEKLVQELERAPELFNLLLRRRWMENYHGSASDKVRVVEIAASALTRTQNRALLDLYMMELASQLDVDLGWVRKTLTSYQTPLARPAAKVVVGKPVETIFEKAANLAETVVTATEPVEKPRVLIAVKKAPRDEAFVLSLLVHHEALMREMIEANADAVIEKFSHPGVRQLLRIAADRYQAKPDNYASLASALTDEVDDSAILTTAIELDQESDAELNENLARKLMSDYMSAIHLRHIDTQSRLLMKELKETPSPEKMQAFMELQRQRHTREDGSEKP